MEREAIAKHVRTQHNGPADTLSRGQFQRFFDLAKKTAKSMSKNPEKLPVQLWQ